MSDAPTCREALQQIVQPSAYGVAIDLGDDALAAARAALAAPDRVATLPPDVRDALQCAADYGPMSFDEWWAKWKRILGQSDTLYAAMSVKCSAVLAKYPETAPVHAEEECAFAYTDDVCNARIEAVRGEMDAERAAWLKERDELIAERDRLKEDAKRDAPTPTLDRVQVNLLTAQVAVWRDRAEWLLSELRKEES